MRQRQNAIHQGRLPDTGVAEQHRRLPGEQVGDDVQRGVPSGSHHGQVKTGELGCERLWRRKVGLRQAQDRRQPTRVGGDQRPLDEPGARWGVGQRDDDQQLVGIGDHHPFGGICVICGAAQHGSAFSASDDAGQGVLQPGQVADDVHVIADDDRGPAEFPGPHRGDHPVRGSAKGTAPPAAVDGDDHRLLGVGVVGSSLGPRPRALARAYPDIGLVVVVRCQGISGACPATMSAHMPGKSGSVLAVVAMSSTATPTTRSPMMAPAVAIRWSAYERQIPPCSGAAVITSPSSDSSHRPPSRLISAVSAASRSVSWPRRWAMPLNLDTDPGSASAAMAATDGASSPTACRSASKPPKLSGPDTSRYESVCRTTAPIFSSNAMMTSAGCTLTRGQPGTRTTPPVTIAAARNGTELDRSGSIAQCRAATGPGGTCHRLASVSSTSTPASRSIDTVIATCGADGTDSPVWIAVSPSANVAPDSSSPDTNCDEAEASISTAPPATGPSPCTRNGRPSPSSATPMARRASSRGAMGRDRACSSPSNVTTSVPSAATGGTKRSTVPASPQSMVAPGAGPIAPLTDSSVPGPSRTTPSVRRAPIMRSVSRLRNAPPTVELPCGVANAASTNARLVCDFEPGTATVARTGFAASGAGQVSKGSIAVHPALSAMSATMEACVGDSR